MPLLLALVRGRRLIALLLISAGLIWFAGMGACYVAFILGILLARHSNWVLAWLKTQKLSIKIGVFLGGLLCYQAFQTFGPSKGSLLMTSLGCVLILLTSMASERIQSLLHLRPMIFLGQISYSVYLLQFIVILCLLPPWVHWLNTLGIGRTLWLLPLTLVFSLGGTVLLAALTYRWVELPCIQLGAWLSRKLESHFLKK